MMKILTAASPCLRWSPVPAPRPSPPNRRQLPPPVVHHRVVHHRVSYNNCKHAAHSGTAGGAVLGALAGQALGHNTGSTVIGGAVGAAAGHQLRYSNCKRRYG